MYERELGKPTGKFFTPKFNLDHLITIFFKTKTKEGKTLTPPLTGQHRRVAMLARTWANGKLVVDCIGWI